MLRRKVLRLATALGFVISSVAFAQDATTPPPAAPPPAAPPAAAPQTAVVGEAPAAAPAKKGDEERTEEIVVTGTRIRRKDLTTPAPVSIVNRDALQNSGKVSLGDFLQALPEQGNTVNTQVNNGNDGSVRVSLRSLGSARTLVLVNGRRMVYGGTGADAAVDLNTIPAAAIERIEILKDGASAVYGSDAIAGVVNVILKRKYTGSEAAAYAGVTGHSDGQTYDVSGMTGSTSERGNFLFSVGYQEQQKVIAGDRNWSKTTYEYDFDTGQKSEVGQSGTFPEGRFAIPGMNATGTGICATGNAAVLALCSQFAATPAGPSRRNAWVPHYDAATGTTTYSMYDGTLYNTYPTNYLLTPNRRIQIFATGDTNLGDIARGFFEASYVNRGSSQDLAPMPVVNTTIPGKPVLYDANNIYNPFGVTLSSWRKRTVEFGGRHFSQDLDTFRVVAGFDGSFGDWAGFARSWQWEASYNYGRTAGSNINTGQVRMPELSNAVGPSMVFNGQPICVRVANDPTTVIPGCTPANMLGGVGALAGAGKDYLAFAGTDKGYDQQQVYALNVSGELFSLPTSERPMGLAVGLEHRLEGAGYQPDVVTAHLESSGNNQLPTAGKYDVTEGYAELSIPLVTNMPGVQDLELSAALRAFHYSTFGSDTTYKFGARYSPIRDVTLRGTYSTAFRAPTVGELYGGTADSYDFVSGDPCKTSAAGNCQPGTPWGVATGTPGSGDTATQFLSKRSPNPNLKPETANIYTAGVVFAPRAVPNLTATLDFYNIDLKHTIDIRGVQYILDQCYGPAGDLAMCSLVQRNPVTGEILLVRDIRDNLGGTKTRGLDMAVRYGLPTPGFGRFNFVFDGTYVIKYDTIDVSNVVTKHAGNYDNQIAMPRFKANTSVLWNLAGLGAGVTGRYIHSYKECESYFCSLDLPGESRSRTVSAYLPIDLFVGYGLKSRAGTTSLTLGVQNVFDLSPPYINSAGNFNSDPGTYDYLGRYFYVRLAQSI